MSLGVHTFETLACLNDFVIGFLKYWRMKVLSVTLIILSKQSLFYMRSERFYHNY